MKLSERIEEVIRDILALYDATEDLPTINILWVQFQRLRDIKLELEKDGH